MAALKDFIIFFFVLLLKCFIFVSTHHAGSFLKGWTQHRIKVISVSPSSRFSLIFGVEMCTGYIGLQYPTLRPVYMKPSMTKDLTHMRLPLSVVAAAVLLQLTIAARFTLPVGFANDPSREAATLEKKAAFSVFLFAETFTFVSAMSALFFIVWSMSCGAEESKRLTHRSVPLLSAALLGSMAVFVTGVSVIYPVPVWPTFAVLIMGFLVVFRFLSLELLFLADPCF